MHNASCCCRVTQTSSSQKSVVASADCPGKAFRSIQQGSLNFVFISPAMHEADTANVTGATSQSAGKKKSASADCKLNDSLLKQIFFNDFRGRQAAHLCEVAQQVVNGADCLFTLPHILCFQDSEINQLLPRYPLHADISKLVLFRCYALRIPRTIYQCKQSLNSKPVLYCAVGLNDSCQILSIAIVAYLEDQADVW